MKQLRLCCNRRLQESVLRLQLGPVSSITWHLLPKSHRSFSVLPSCLHSLSWAQTTRSSLTSGTTTFQEDCTYKLLLIICERGHALCITCFARNSIHTIRSCIIACLLRLAFKILYECLSMVYCPLMKEKTMGYS